MSSLSATRVSRLTRYRQLAPSVSVRVCPICLGMMNFGNAFSSSLGDCTKDTAFDILDHFVKQGGNFIDTANGYQQGQSETWLGDWLTCRQNRDEMVIATKYTGLYKQSSSEAWQVNANYGGNGLLAQPGLRQFVVYQGLWNAAARDFERDIIPMCRDEGMGLVPWGGGGLIQGAFRARRTLRRARQTTTAGAGRHRSMTGGSARSWKTWQQPSEMV